MPRSSLNGTVEERPVLARGAGQQVLIVADEPDVAELLSTTLELAGYRTSLVGTGTEALARAVEHRYDLVVLDAAVPDLASLAPGRRLPAEHRPPVLFLTACDSLDRLLPEVGPGERDYVTKPFRVAEVLARMRVLLRGPNRGPNRGARRDSGPGYCDLVLDGPRCQAWRGARALDLTPAEYRLLRHLLVHAHQVLSKEQIGRHVWGEFRGDNAIEQLVSRLRRKVDREVDREAPALIHTRRGFGYWLGTADAEG